MDVQRFKKQLIKYLSEVDLENMTEEQELLVRAEEVIEHLQEVIEELEDELEGLL